MEGVYHTHRTDLLYPELSFNITGVLFDVHNSLGGGHPEKYYQKAIALGLQKQKIHFQQQYYVPLRYNQITIGKYYLDFLIEDTIVLELKRGKYYSRGIINQTRQYLDALGLQLGILACFGHDAVITKRIVNLISDS
jgi:GxxExxY protein